MNLLVIASLAAAAAGECPPAADVAGDEGLAADVSSALERRGLRESRAECPRVHVNVRRHGPMLALTIERPGEPTIERIAEHVEGAATIVESWLRADLAAPLLVGRPRPRPRRPTPTPAATVPEPAPVETEVARPLQPRSFTIGMGGVMGQASDGSTWTGVDLRGCFRVGAFCFGGRAQYAVDVEIAGEAQELNGDRSFIDVGITAELPIALGAFELQPGIALGQAILQSERVIDGRTVEDDTGGLRLRAQLGVAYRFDDRVSARLEFAFDYAPFAQPELYESFVDDGPETVQLPSEPSTIGWVRLGVDLGGI